MSDWCDVNTVTVKKNVINSTLSTAPKLETLPSSISNSLAPHDQLLTICSGVEPAVTCADSRYIIYNYQPGP